MYYTEAMAEADERAGATTIRTIRMYDDAWDLIGARSKDRSTFVRDMTDAGLQVARCYRCFEPVPVEYADLTGKPFAEWVAEAQKTVTRQHRDGHHPIVVGARVPAPRPEPRRPAPGSAVFLEPQPGAVPYVAAAVPEVPAQRGRRGRR